MGIPSIRPTALWCTTHNQMRCSWALQSGKWPVKCSWLDLLLGIKTDSPNGQFEHTTKEILELSIFW